MNKRTFITLGSVTGVFIILALLMGKVYKIGQSRPPMIYTTIPDGTVKFLEGMIRFGGHMAGVDLVLGGPFDWENDKDYGQVEDEWSREEDEFFIVYYKKDKEAVWQGYAQHVLKAANDNILPLTRLMGKYYYPQDANGRKLPIYLTRSVEEYYEVASTIQGKLYPPNNSVGVTISQLGNAGCKSSVVLHPVCFEYPPREPSGYVTVLMHEMNHYVFLSSIDWSKDVSFYNWEIEGIADYCANNFTQNHLSINEKQLDYIEHHCSLLDDFHDDNAEYWAGESFFRYMEAAHGEATVKQFLRKAYETKTEETFSKLSLDPEKEHTYWVEVLKNQLEKEKVVELGN